MSQFVSRKDLQRRYDRGAVWVRELTRHPSVGNYGGRYDVKETDKVLRAGFKPTSAGKCRKM